MLGPYGLGASVGLLLVCSRSRVGGEEKLQSHDSEHVLVWRRPCTNMTTNSVSNRTTFMDPDFSIFTDCGRLYIILQGVVFRGRRYEVKLTVISQ